MESLPNDLKTTIYQFYKANQELGQWCEVTRYYTYTPFTFDRIEDFMEEVSTCARVFIHRMQLQEYTCVFVFETYYTVEYCSNIPEIIDLIHVYFTHDTFFHDEIKYPCDHEDGYHASRVNDLGKELKHHLNNTQRIWNNVNRIYFFNLDFHKPHLDCLLYLQGKSMTNVALKHKTIYDWYNKNQHDKTRFTPSANVQYRYMTNVNGYVKVSNNIGNVSLECNLLSQKYNLSLMLNNILHNKIYLQVTPKDIYFVVPVMHQNKICGMHFSIHYIQQYNPPWNKNMSFSNTIDIHKTCYEQRLNKIIHQPMCVFHDNMQVPLQSNGMDVSKIVCLNKVQTSAYKYFDHVFSLQQERDLIEDVLTLPYKSSANKIHAAWKKYKNMRGGYKMHTHKLPDVIASLHAIIIKHDNKWNYSVYTYNHQQDLLKVTLFTLKHISNKEIIRHVIKDFQINPPFVQP